MLRSSSVLKTVNAVVQSHINTTYFHEQSFEACIKDMKFIELDNGVCRGEYVVTKAATNGFGTLHGGFIATLVSNCTTFAILTKNLDAEQSTANLHINYLSASKPGDTVYIDAKIDKIGRQMAFTSCTLSDANKPEKILATATHSKILQAKVATS